jgi:hypothetical protein
MANRDGGNAEALRIGVAFGLPARSRGDQILILRLPLPPCAVRLSERSLPTMARPPLGQSNSTASHRAIFDEQEWTDFRANAQTLRNAEAQLETDQRRLADPTTCEGENSEAELEFTQAMKEYKHQSGRMFPTWSEVLEVLTDLGYEKPAGPA